MALDAGFNVMESTWEGGVAGSRLVVGGVGGRGKDVVGLKVVDDGSD